jgi:PhnB protein
MARQVKAIPEGFHTVTPHLVVHGAAEAIDFYKKAFGATELRRMPGPGGKLLHAEVQIGDSRIFLVDDFPDMGSLSPVALKGTPVTFHLYVENADSVFEQAVKAGAQVLMPLADQFWGDRYGLVADPFGHRWSIASHVKDLTPEQMQKAGQAAMAQMERKQ